MKFAILCDMHLPNNASAAQFDYLDMAVEDIAKQSPDLLIVAGDIVAAGEKEPFDYYLKKLDCIKNIRTVTLLGNADVRNNQNDFAQLAKDVVIEGAPKIICLNTPYGKIERLDLLDSLADGDILIFHHGIDGLEETSRCAVNHALESKRITLIHAHKHYFFDMTVGKSRVISVRALDPDKSVGAPPCITYFEAEGDKISFCERIFGIDKGKISDFREYMGISCFDIQNSVDVAIKYGIKNLELRRYAQDDGLFDYTVDKINAWRAQGGNTLSIHMPNIFWKEGGVDAPAWDYALKLAQATGVNSYTMHPPKELVDTVTQNFETFVDYYYGVISKLPKNVPVGIENVHTSAKNPLNERKYGCIPQEVCALIDGINARFGYERVGAVLDVGHARNNPPFNQVWTNSMWQAVMGKKTVAYHIHQVVKSKELGKMVNHQGIANWFGPMISYSSFFYDWQKNRLNHRPAFLEVKDINGAIASIQAFDELENF